MTTFTFATRSIMTAMVSGEELLRASSQIHAAPPYDAEANMIHLKRLLSIILCLFVAPATFAQTTTSAPTNFGIILSTGMAPCTIHVQALDLPLPTGRRLTARYQWDFGDPSGRYNQLSGWNAAHVYDRAGRFTITLTLTEESGATRKFTKTIEISPDTRKRIYVSTRGNDTNDG